MAEMAVMPMAIYSKNPFKNFFSRTNGPMTLEL